MAQNGICWWSSWSRQSSWCGSKHEIESYSGVHLLLFPFFGWSSLGWLFSMTLHSNWRSSTIAAALSKCLNNCNDLLMKAIPWTDPICQIGALVHLPYFLRRLWKTFIGTTFKCILPRLSCGLVSSTRKGVAMLNSFIGIDNIPMPPRSYNRVMTTNQNLTTSWNVDEEMEAWTGGYNASRHDSIPRSLSIY